MARQEISPVHRTPIHVVDVEEGVVFLEDSPEHLEIVLGIPGWLIARALGREVLLASEPVAVAVPRKESKKVAGLVESDVAIARQVVVIVFRNAANARYRVGLCRTGADLQDPAVAVLPPDAVVRRRIDLSCAGRPRGEKGKQLLVRTRGEPPGRVREL